MRVTFTKLYKRETSDHLPPFPLLGKEERIKKSAKRYYNSYADIL